MGNSEFPTDTESEALSSLSWLNSSSAARSLGRLLPPGLTVGTSDHNAEEDLGQPPRLMPDWLDIVNHTMSSALSSPPGIKVLQLPCYLQWFPCQAQVRGSSEGCTTQAFSYVFSPGRLASLRDCCLPALWTTSKVLDVAKETY